MSIVRILSKCWPHYKVSLRSVGIKVRKSVLSDLIEKKKYLAFVIIYKTILYMKHGIYSEHREHTVWKKNALLPSTEHIVPVLYGDEILQCGHMKAVLTFKDEYWKAQSGWNRQETRSPGREPLYKIHKTSNHRINPIRTGGWVKYNPPPP